MWKIFHFWYQIRWRDERGCQERKLAVEVGKSFSFFLLVKWRKSAEIWKWNPKAEMTWKAWRSWNLLNVCRECACQLTQLRFEKSTSNLCFHKNILAMCINPTHTCRHPAICLCMIFVRFLFPVFIWRQCVSFLEQKVLSARVVIWLALSPFTPAD